MFGHHLISSTYKRFLFNHVNVLAIYFNSTKPLHMRYTVSSTTLYAVWRFHVVASVLSSWAWRTRALFMTTTLLKVHFLIFFWNRIVLINYLIENFCPDSETASFAMQLYLKICATCFILKGIVSRAFDTIDNHKKYFHVA